jgi:feruloyl esterase
VSDGSASGNGAHDPERGENRQGVEVFPGREPGSELGWGFFFSGEGPATLLGDSFKYIVFKDPNWDWRTFDLERDLARADAAGELKAADATDPNLSAFAGHGGKLLMYHGWGDVQIAPVSTINYYNRVLAAMGGAGKTSGWIRLFMVPAMGHCRGGDGPNTFDAVAALEEWIEARRPPERIIATHLSAGVPDRTRPLCPYPQLAIYKGSGSIDEAVNFTCKAR